MITKWTYKFENGRSMKDGEAFVQRNNNPIEWIDIPKIKYTHRWKYRDDILSEISEINQE